MIEIPVVQCPECGYRVHPAHAIERCGQCGGRNTHTNEALTLCRLH